MDIRVGVGDMKISDDSTAVLVTHSLGSCIGLAVYDPVEKVGGLLHYMLPDSTKSSKGKDRPFMFADTGIPLLYKSCYKLGAKKGRMIAKAAGGAQVMAASEKFEIGKRNHAALRKILFRNNILIDVEDVGGSVSRTVRMNIATGEVNVKIAGRDNKVL